MAQQSAKPTIQHPPFIASRVLNAPHGFFGREGGVSTGVYQSLNTGFSVGDDVSNVIENNARICRAIGADPASRAGLNQIHGNICHVVTEVWHAGKAPDGDALVTAVPGITLSVLSADCAPVLFEGDGVIGAAHAGWGGAVKGVLESTLDAMKKLGAKNIRAAIGPCIGPQSYEVSKGFEEPFLAQDAASAQFFRDGAAGKLMFDLPGYCAFRLKRAGLDTVDMIGQDTVSLEDRYFSHRRTTLAGETRRGLQMSVITVKHS